ncbi:MAG: pentapeptide repeat-containing protein [Thermoanaerobaculia bacterium]|nr:pentapeptide repeat-containing protein [Thermoanaerobaculia bacterium]
MANQEHVHRLLQGVWHWNDWRSSQDEDFQPDLSGHHFDRGTNFAWRGRGGAEFQRLNLQGANFLGAKLQEADFFGAKLQGAIFIDAELEWANFANARLGGAMFEEANLEGARFYFARLEGARFNAGRLEGAYFQRAKLEGAYFLDAKLQEADFIGAELEGANFVSANLQGANFLGAKLQGANFSSSRGLLLDQSFAVPIALDRPSLLREPLARLRAPLRERRWPRWLPGAELRRETSDPWSALRLTYSGSRLLFQLLLLLAFFFPLIARVTFWSGVNQAQAALVPLNQELKAAVEKVENENSQSLEGLKAEIESVRRRHGLAPAAEGEIRRLLERSNRKPKVELLLMKELGERIARTSPCLRPDCDSAPVIGVLLGSEDGWRSTTVWLGLILLTYQSIRIYLTYSVVCLRDAEIITQRSPALDEYRVLYTLHKVASGLFYVAIAAFLL